MSVYHSVSVFGECVYVSVCMQVCLCLSVNLLARPSKVAPCLIRINIKLFVEDRVAVSGGCFPVYNKEYNFNTETRGNMA